MSAARLEARRHPNRGKEPISVTRNLRAGRAMVDSPKTMVVQSMVLTQRAPSIAAGQPTLGAIWDGTWAAAGRAVVRVRFGAYLELAALNQEHGATNATIRVWAHDLKADTWSVVDQQTATVWVAAPDADWTTRQRGPRVVSVGYYGERQI